MHTKQLLGRLPIQLLFVLRVHTVTHYVYILSSSVASIAAFLYHKAYTRCSNFKLFHIREFHFSDTRLAIGFILPAPIVNCLSPLQQEKEVYPGFLPNLAFVLASC